MKIFVRASGSFVVDVVDETESYYVAETDRSQWILDKSKLETDWDIHKYLYEYTDQEDVPFQIDVRDAFLVGIEILPRKCKG